PFLSRPSLTGHCGHCWTCSLPRPVAHDPTATLALRLSAEQEYGRIILLAGHLRCHYTESTSKMGDHLVGVHDIGVFMVHVEQVYLVRQQAAVETAFLDEHYVITMRVGVDRACAYTAGRGFATDDYALN